ncbi:hypothetical protein AAAC51_41025 [Priestia megaterium]
MSEVAFCSEEELSSLVAVSSFAGCSSVVCSVVVSSLVVSSEVDSSFLAIPFILEVSYPDGASQGIPSSTLLPQPSNLSGSFVAVYPFEFQ